MVRLFLLLSLFLGACAGTSGLNLGYYPDPGATYAHFNLCHGYGCTHLTVTGFTDKEWKKIKKIFAAKSKTPAAERLKIAKAIALMERYTGEKVGTKVDLPKAPIKKSSDMELDCIDETINTTKYLTFLQDDGLLKFHSVGNPVYKGMFINGVYPHNSAAVRENDSDDIYVIDSYIYKNGEQPNIRPLDSWLKYRVEDLPKK